MVCRASVIVPTYNKSRYLDLTLASFLHQDSADYEIVVVDDGSTDDTPSVIGRYEGRLPIRSIHQTNQGRGKARNAAIHAATGDILVFSDDDRLVTPGFVRSHLEQFSSPTDRCQVLGWQQGILTRWEPGARLELQHLLLLQRDPDLRRMLEAGELVEIVTPADVERDLAPVFERYGTVEAWWENHCRPLIEHPSIDLEVFPLSWGICTTGNMSVPRAHVLEIGGFDLGFSGWGLEDTELSYRLWRAGCVTRHSRAALSYHQLHPSPPQKMMEWRQNLHYFHDRHQGVDAYLFSLLMQGRDPVQLDALAREVHRLQESGGSIIIDELRRVYRLQDEMGRLVARGSRGG